MLAEFASQQEVLIHPGSSLGSFQLGWDIIACVKELRREERRFGKWLVTGDVGNARPVGAPVSIYLPKMQTHLHFHPMIQRLERITVANVETFGGGELRYKNRVLCGPRHSPTFSRVIDVLGPTFQGSIDAETGRYSLRYPGITVEFDIPSGYVDCYTGDHSELPVTLPDGTSPLATALTVEPPSATQFAARIRMPVSGLVVCADTIVVDPKRGIRFTRSGVSVTFGMAPQEVICLLGGPETLYPKQDDRLLIHNPALNKRHANASASPSYFLTFPLLGIDVMFDGVTHRVVKIMCFNSIPPHETFLRYLRAHFTVDHNGLKVDGNTNFLEEVKPFLPRAPQPLLHSHNGIPMRIYCFRGIIYYVLGNGLIASIMVFEAPNPPPGGSTTQARPVVEASLAAPMRKDYSSFTVSPTASPPPPPLLADEQPPPSVGERQRPSPAAIDDALPRPEDPFQFFMQSNATPFPEQQPDRHGHSSQSVTLSAPPPMPRLSAVGSQDSREGVSPVSADDERSGADSFVRRGDNAFGTPVLRNIRHGFDALVRPFSPDSRAESDRQRSHFFAELQMPSDLWESPPVQSEETAVFTSSPSRSRADQQAAPPATLRASPRTTTSESAGADESESRSGASGWESVAQSSDDPAAQAHAPAAEVHGRRHKKSKKGRT